MFYKKLKPVEVDKTLEIEMQNKIFPITTILVKELMSIIKVSYHNVKLTPLQEAIKSGKVIFYPNETGGEFKGYFTKEVAREIRELGGIFNSKTNTYIIKQPTTNFQFIIKFIEDISKSNQKTYKMLLEEIKKFDVNKSIKKVDFTKTFAKIIKDTHTKVDKSIVRVRPNLGIKIIYNEKELREIANKYSNNMKRYIKHFLNDEVKILRQEIKANLHAGKLAKDVEEIIKERFGVSQNKARFLARQETALCVATEKQAKYNNYGIEKYKWLANLDSKVRHDHKLLDNLDFFYKKPPITDRRTGARNNPGEDYNCRCVDIPLLPN